MNQEGAADEPLMEPGQTMLHPDVIELHDVIFSDAFRDGYISVGTAKEREAVGKAEHMIGVLAEKEFGQRIHARVLEIDPQDDGLIRKLRDRVQAIDEARLGTNPSRDFSDLQETEASAREKVAKRKAAQDKVKNELMLQKISIISEITQQLTSTLGQQAKSELAVAIASLEKTSSEFGERVEQLKKEFDERKNDPELVRALAVWGRSPTASDDRGPDGKGYNAGVIHFYAYRADKEKAGRYQPRSSMAIGDFIKYSAGLKELIDNPDPGKNTENVSYARVLADTEGNLRLVLLSRRGTEVITFSPVREQNFKVVTVLINKDKKDIDADVDKELTGDPKARLNKLGDGIRELSMSDAMTMLQLRRN